MKSLMSLWRELAIETASWCRTSANRDIKTVADRTKAEGESFLTISLPQFSKDFEQALELGSINSSLFRGFHKRGGLPVFLSGYLSQIFGSGGALLDVPNVDCIRAVRQLTLVFAKIERPCTKVRVDRAMERFVEIEAELESVDPSGFEEYLPLFQKVSTFLWADICASVENKISGTSQLADEWLMSDEIKSLNNLEPQVSRHVDVFFESAFPKQLGAILREWVIDDSSEMSPFLVDDVVPRHGPGATADRLRGNAKFDVSEWNRRLEDVFPYGDYALPSWRSYYQLDRVQFLEPGRERPVKVTPVPKTLKTPRIIAIEPTCMQYMQQAIAHEMVNEIEDGRKVGPHSGSDQLLNFGSWFVGFKEQEPNRLLARAGSINGQLATLDLSEASDRVLNRHVELLFARFPRLSAAIQATRSTKADVPGHGIIPLAKFASMGSALCFPVEAMVFATIVFTAICYERRVPPSRKLFFELRDKVRVYGDDIIVPVEYVQSVIQFLSAFGLIVNMDKSFWNGKFRESCGGDYFDGEWVTPVRLRKDLPRSLADVENVVSLVSFRNLLYWNGFWKTAAKLDEELKSLLKGHWSIVESTAAGLGRSSVLPYQADKMDDKLHVPLVQGARVRLRTPVSPVSGEGALLKFFLKRGLTPSQDPTHLERQGRPEAVGIKLRGIRPY